ncbi:amino acid ABC transporter permease [Mangrovicella endophytica]|uniref:amino acid ABC transporter permease n=1 Tax=Mangrovicella endophytica TaxID=2066697 RepID=UPI000C9E9A02|nr:amino acid ABC transporter permease [Mangrovicella endophytica]
MEEQVAPFVARGQKEPLPPPRSEFGIYGRVRRSLFATPTDAVLTLAALIFIVWAGYHIIEWAVINAVFTGSDRTACLPTGDGEIGACWAFIRAKYSQFVYGLYPLDQRWRVDLVFALLAVLSLGLAIPSVPYKRWNAVLLFAVFPFVALVLLTGGEFELSGGGIALIVLAAALASYMAAGSQMDAAPAAPFLKAAGLLMILALLVLLAAGPVSSRRVEFLNVDFSILSMAGFVLAGLALVAAVAGGLRAGGTAVLMSLLMPILAGLALIVVMTTDFGLRPVGTNLWGGLLVTLVVAVSGIAASLPLGIMLALGRRSDMPTVRLLSIIFIEFWRGVPLITVLFMANFMLPLFLPDGVNFNQLLRALVGVALFSAAYMAEVIRGGLQAIPKGQYEAADAMALSYWQKMRMIVLPQALKLVIPGIVNTFIGLFKDTSLVYIIGLADLLGTVRRGFSDPNWITESTPATGLIFAAFIYWLFCFSMSRYSIWTERRLDTGHKR